MAFITPDKARFGYETYNISKTAYNKFGDKTKSFSKWECYMLLKYGSPNQFGKKAPDEYLIELPIYPETVTESIDPSWGTQTILGRSSPISAYANTSLKRVNFELTLHRDAMTGSGVNQTANNSDGQAAGYQTQSLDGHLDTRNWFVNINKMLQMSCYPQYTANGLIPPTTYFVFGQMILKGYVTSYSTSWKKPILNTFYAWNTVNISMDCYPDTIITANDIIAGPGAMSTQNTYNTIFPDKSTIASDVSTVRWSINGKERTNLRDPYTSLGGNPMQT